jgi:hypothetical protein
VRAAAENNAWWCDAVCRSHGLATRFIDGLWVAPEGSPQFYPDVVTIRPDVSAADVMTHLPSAADSVKDSFACVDLDAEGFGVLFDACWLVHRSPHSMGTELAWTAVESVGELVEWVTAAALDGIIRADLLADPSIRIFAARRSHDAPIEAGAIANVTEQVVGLSNVFSEDEDTHVVWNDLPGVVATWFPGHAIVGYEVRDALAAAIASGFTPLDPLRVWHRQLAQGGRTSPQPDH